MENRKELVKIMNKIKRLIEPDKSKWAETFAQYKYLSNKDNDTIRCIITGGYIVATLNIIDEYGVYKHSITLYNDGMLMYIHSIPAHYPNSLKLGYDMSSMLNDGYRKKSFTVPIYDKELWDEILEFCKNSR